MISWSRVRKNGAVSIGTKMIGDTEITWTIKKSTGGLNYELHLGEITSVPMYTRATINECKVIAEVYL